MILEEFEPIREVEPTVLTEFIRSIIAEELEKRFGDQNPKKQKRYQVPINEPELMGPDGIIKRMSKQGYGVGYIKSFFLKELSQDIPEHKIIPLHEQVIREYENWNTLPLETVYPIVWIESLKFSNPTGKKLEKSELYYAHAIDMEGFKRFLGIWIPEKDKKIPLIFGDLKSRGVQDILLMVAPFKNNDAETVQGHYPRASIQTNIFQQIRETKSLVPYSLEMEVFGQIAPLYKSKSFFEAKRHLDVLTHRWGSRLPKVCQKWQTIVENFDTYYLLPDIIRKKLYSPQIVDKIHSKMTQVLKTGDSFKAEQIQLILYHYQKELSERFKGRKIYRWKSLLMELDQRFPNRLNGLL